MPALVMQTFPFTLLVQTHKGSVRRQIAYGAERGVPWGVSESRMRCVTGCIPIDRGFGVPDRAQTRTEQGARRSALRDGAGNAGRATAIVKNLATPVQKALGPHGFRDAWTGARRRDRGRWWPRSWRTTSG
jgi:hypothetical protein